MRKPNQPVDSVNTSGLLFDTKQEQVPVVVTPEVEVAVVEVEVKEEPVVVEEVAEVAEVAEEKVEPKKASKKKDAEDDDVVPLSFINKASESSDK
ncbi:hypothetical protein UFOVP1217_100 [uncultured Caudovirales phage]|uniref:Uncharacterized protein n=1 Tax=uncultured Caudovirales phage TaxID=2100421 RepID=A0A6J5SGJ7_9CAUD|nr:hypothetical protein UFOVP465_178 [uncultured Caudovirales phage]CAB4156012.1 hypothetical protein UFOVP666_36 [uncultured Caudovirales phage]CAB4164696.1 hypothetical protein UFOVP819_64 [uncultured Caudovirales phage]CAB4178344.1 hypothetical protein UFOVP1002_95 [uncultured Caudovirales phage]CAB4191702.1 hypothetical protein UFOVP1217_100 [uncultured Caudovirales phage]